ncbi:MAG: hypothetical protein IJ133_06845 [Clostridia bacterium]|nr:hypothetical protein [Clostridia bacterium]
MAKQMTSAEAGKLLRSLQQELDNCRELESKSATFSAAVEEDEEKIRPDYDFAKTQEELDGLERQIRQLKHAINVFNLTTEVPGFAMTVDQMLVYLPQQTARRDKLRAMQGRLPRERQASYNSNFIEYTIANYDIEQAKAAYLKAADEVTRAQLALDKVNSTVPLTVELD